MELEQTRVDLRAEVDDVLSMFGERTRKKPQVEVAAFVHDSVPETIIGDALRFRQVRAFGAYMFFWDFVSHFSAILLSLNSSFLEPIIC